MSVPPLWWLSFCDPDRPKGTQFLGVAIVCADTLPVAAAVAHVLGINPGGQISSFGPMPIGWIHPRWIGRLLTKEEAESIPEPPQLALEDQ